MPWEWQQEPGKQKQSQVVTPWGESGCFLLCYEPAGEEPCSLLLWSILGVMLGWFEACPSCGCVRGGGFQKPCSSSLPFTAGAGDRVLVLVTHW